MLDMPLVLADYAGTVQLADTSGLRARTTETTDAPTGTTPLGIDVVTQPSLQGRLVDSQWEYTLGYALWLIEQDIEDGIVGCSTCVLQSNSVANAGIAWHSRLVRVSVNENATYGYFSSGNLLPAAAGAETTTGQTGQTSTTTTGTTPLQTATAPTAITSGSLRTTGRVSVQLDRRASLALGVSQWLSGGLDSGSRSVLPFQYGGRGDAAFSYVLSKRERAETLAFVQATYFSPLSPNSPTTAGADCEVSGAPGSTCAPQDQLADLREVITHSLDPATTLSLSGGLTVARTRQDPSNPFRVLPFPNGDISLSRRFGMFGERGDATMLLDAALAPVVDQVTGLVSNRAQGQVSLTDRLDEVVTMTATASAAQTVPTTEPFALTLVTGNLELGYLVSRSVALAVGERAWWQHETQVGSFISTFTYLDITVTAPTLRF